MAPRPQGSAVTRRSLTGRAVLTLTGIGLSVGLAACGGGNAPTPPTPQQWAISNLGNIQHVDDLVKAGQIDQAVDAWDTIPVPPSDAADWKQATNDLHVIRDDFDRGDQGAQLQDGVTFNQDITLWANSFQNLAGGIGD